MRNEHALQMRLRRAVAPAFFVMLGLGTFVGSGCSCSGELCNTHPFPDEPLQPIVEPSEATIQVGATVTFSVLAPGLGDPAYQWFRAASGGPPVPIAGATEATYTLVGAQLPDDGATFSVSVHAGFEGQLALVQSSGSTLAVSSMPPVVFQDSEFASADWSGAAIVVPPGGGATHDEQQASTGGNPGAYRKVTLSMPGGIAKLSAFSIYQSASYDPPSQGAIYLVDFAQDCIALPGVLGVGPQLLIEQDGRRYAAGNSGSCDATWRRQVFLRGSFDATQFLQIDGPACAASEHCPDFSALGKPLRFGFVNFNQGSAGFAGASGGVGIDNWVVRVWRR